MVLNSGYPSIGTGFELQSKWTLFFKKKKNRVYLICGLSRLFTSLNSLLPHQCVVNTMSVNVVALDVKPMEVMTTQMVNRSRP